MLQNGLFKMQIDGSDKCLVCCFAPQVDLVGSEKLNNSMGFSMFFVGLGCLTGPPLAGEWFTSWKTFKHVLSHFSKGTQWEIHTVTHNHMYYICMWCDDSKDVTFVFVCVCVLFLTWSEWMCVSLSGCMQSLWSVKTETQEKNNLQSELAWRHRN